MKEPIASCLTSAAWTGSNQRDKKNPECPVLEAAQVEDAPAATLLKFKYDRVEPQLLEAESCEDSGMGGVGEGRGLEGGSMDKKTDGGISMGNKV